MRTSPLCIPFRCELELRIETQHKGMTMRKSDSNSSTGGIFEDNVGQLCLCRGREGTGRSGDYGKGGSTMEGSFPDGSQIPCKNGLLAPRFSPCLSDHVYI